MLDTHARKYINPLIDGGANFLINLKLTPNNATQLALILGVISAGLLYINQPIVALAVLWISGYLDAVDGAMARKTNQSSPFGTLMDITGDRIVELGIIIVCAMKYEHIRMNSIILVSCILLSMVIFLTVGAMTEKSGIKSFYYQPGLAERSEGFIMLSLMILFPEYLSVIINIFSLIVLITAAQRYREASKILK